jgi:hypothetical protein
MESLARKSGGYRALDGYEQMEIKITAQGKFQKGIRESIRAVIAEVGKIITTALEDTSHVTVVVCDKKIQWN